MPGCDTVSRAFGLPHFNPANAFQRSHNAAISQASFPVLHLKCNGITTTSNVVGPARPGPTLPGQPVTKRCLVCLENSDLASLFCLAWLNAVHFSDSDEEKSVQQSIAAVNISPKFFRK